MNVIGLMSGTSGDGVDAALVRIQGRGHALRVEPLAFRPHPYPASLQRRIVEASTSGTVAEICHLNALLGELFAEAALGVIQKAGLRPGDIHLIGSHGQTVHHLPKGIREPGIGLVRSTLQIAAPAVIAERTGVTTVSDFRSRDLAAGGEGAPLTPYAHYLLLRHPRRSRLIVNLGGISNVTYLPRGGSAASVRAFDAGPGNMVLDGLIQRLTKGRSTMDYGGRLAAKGRVDRRLLNELMAHPFLKRRPPKSTGREEFGEPVVARILNARRACQLSPADLLATCAMWTAQAVGGARRWLHGAVDEVVAGGGGVRNRTLMTYLASVFDPIPVKTFNDLGWDSKAFEAVAFALLAYQTMAGECAKLPAVTGATHPVLLGAIVPGTPGWMREVRRERRKR